jgi:hypothetical protein
MTMMTIQYTVQYSIVILEKSLVRLTRNVYLLFHTVARTQFYCPIVFRIKMFEWQTL